MNLIGLLITLLLLALVFGVIWWGITVVMAEFPPPSPIGKVIRVVFALIVVLVLVGLLFGYVPVPIYPWR